MSKSDKYSTFESPNLLLNNLKRSKRKNLAVEKKERLASLQAPPTLASKIESAMARPKRGLHLPSRPRAGAQQKGGNVHGSVEGIPGSTEKTLDLRKLSCSTLDMKKRISEQINFSMRKVQEERSKDDGDQLNECDQIEEKEGSIIDEVLRRNNTAGPVDTLKLPDEKLFTSSLQVPERKRIHRDLGGDKIIVEKPIATPAKINDADASPSPQSIKSILSNSNHMTSSECSAGRKPRELPGIVIVRSCPSPSKK